MESITVQELKRTLAEQGFIVFRTRGDEVTLAERVRENLIMDSGIRLRASSPLRVTMLVRAQRNDFPAEDEDAILERLRGLAGSARAEGFVEEAASVTPIRDPSNADRILDHTCAVTLCLDVGGLDDALRCVRFAFSLERMLGPKKPR